MSFAQDFRERIIPRMRGEARKQAVLVAIGEIDFEDAAHAVRMVAINGGVGLLTVEQREAVFDPVPDLIWKEYEAALVRQTEDEAALAADPVRYYEDLAVACREPEKMRWTFAAICPEYRAYLIAARCAR
jgi:hypothetical protein